MTGTTVSTPSATGRTPSARNLDRISVRSSGPRSPSGSKRPIRRRTRGLSSRRPPDAGGATSDHGNAMAQAFHHTILPLASLADRRTEIRWGIRDFEFASVGRPEGCGCRETAVDLPTLRLLAEHGIRYTILAPWQSADRLARHPAPYRVELGGGRTIAVAFYDGALSGAVSFDPAATADADTFVRDRLIPRFGMSPRSRRRCAAACSAAPRRRARARPDATASLAAPRHATCRDRDRRRAVRPPPVVPRPVPAAPPLRTRERRGRPAAPTAASIVVHAGDAFAEAGADSSRVARIRNARRGAATTASPAGAPSARTLPTAAGRAPCGRHWNGWPAAIDAVTTKPAARGSGRRLVAAARDAYVDVVIGVATREAFARARWVGRRPRPPTGDRFLDLMEAQRWRLAMFQSDAWFWDDPVRSRAARCCGRRPAPCGSLDVGPGPASKPRSVTT